MKQYIQALCLCLALVGVSGQSYASASDADSEDEIDEISTTVLLHQCYAPDKTNIVYIDVPSGYGSEKAFEDMLHKQVESSFKKYCILQLENMTTPKATATVRALESCAPSDIAIMYTVSKNDKRGVNPINLEKKFIQAGFGSIVHIQNDDYDTKVKELMLPTEPLLFDEKGHAHKSKTEKLTKSLESVAGIVSRLKKQSVHVIDTDENHFLEYPDKLMLVSDILEGLRQFDGVLKRLDLSYTSITHRQLKKLDTILMEKDQKLDFLNLSGTHLFQDISETLLREMLEKNPCLVIQAIGMPLTCDDDGIAWPTLFGYWPDDIKCRFIFLDKVSYSRAGDKVMRKVHQLWWNAQT